MFIAGLITGVAFGGMASLFLVCVVTAGSRADQRMADWKREKEDTKEAGSRRVIRFVDILNEELFCIDDGECIELFARNGESRVCLCRYLDRRHTSIAGKRWEMLNFARKMNRDGIVYMPLSEQRRKGGVAA